ncbi:Rix1 complex component [Scheffersomyces amazonensis]|uniref:Rix1 complex component n=1 Tax=Scheffersomyces amazonensis TaxID=1078765 RepID=UPI00315CD839
MASKRKRTEKQKDFVKAKLKVGKTAKKPDNYTDTSFTAKTISLPNQSIQSRVSNAGSSSTSSGSASQTDIDLTHQLSLTKHHSSSTRKEVLLYIQNHLPANNPSLYKQIVASTVPLILDTSMQVRTQLISLLTECANKQPGLLDLHIRSIILFIHSAMTHIQPEIRNSASKFLAILIEHAPSSLVKSYFIKTLRSYFTLMSWTLTTDKKSVSLAITTSSTIGNSSVKKARSHHVSILKSFLNASLFIEEQKNNDIDEENVILTHPQSLKYLVPTTSQPFTSLKLFTADMPRRQISSTDKESMNSGSSDDGKFHIADLDTLSTEDISTRRKIIIDIFLHPLTKNLNNLIKEGGEVGKEAKGCLTVLEKLTAEISSNKENETTI